MTPSIFKKVITFIKNKLGKVEEDAALNRSSIGLQRKNLLKNKCLDTDAVGLTLTVDNDGVININGVHTNNVASVIYWNMANGSKTQAGQFIDSERRIPPGTYILSGGAENVAIQMCVDTEEQFQAKYDTPKYSVYQGKTTVTITEQDKYVWFRVRIKEGNINFNNVKLYPMLRPIEVTDSTYEPYFDDLQTQVNGITDILGGCFKNSGIRITGNQSANGIHDFNEAVITGMYKYSASPANKPGTQTYGLCLVFNPGNNVDTTGDGALYICQVAIAGVAPSTFNNSITNTAGIYFRTSNDGGKNWSNWFKLAYTDMINPTS